MKFFSCGPLIDYMELDEAIHKRYMVRRYKDEPVPEDLIEKLIINARQAPSVGFMQPAEWIIVKDEEQKTRLARAALNQMFIAEAPVVIVAVANTRRSASRYGQRGREFYSLIDTAFGSMNLLLTARAENLGAAFIGAFHDDEVSQVLELPDYVQPVGIIPVGCPDEPARDYKRFDIEKIVHYERW
jgi:nitroreductase